MMKAEMNGDGNGDSDDDYLVIIMSKNTRYYEYLVIIMSKSNWNYEYLVIIMSKKIVITIVLDMTITKP